MGPIRLILNILWFVLGGLLAGLAWFAAGILAAVTIVGLPWAFGCFRIGSYTLWPFGRDVVWTSELTGRPGGLLGALRFIGNVIWFFPVGLSLMVIHVLAAAACFISIIGIPFGWAHLKLAAASVFPLGQTIVASDVADLARRHSAATTLAGWRRA